MLRYRRRRLRQYVWRNILRMRTGLLSCWSDWRCMLLSGKYRTCNTQDKHPPLDKCPSRFYPKTEGGMIAHTTKMVASTTISSRSKSFNSRRIARRRLFALSPLSKGVCCLACYCTSIYGSRRHYCTVASDSLLHPKSRSCVPCRCAIAILFIAAELSETSSTRTYRTLYM